MQNLQGLQQKQQHLRDVGFNNAMAMNVHGHGADGDFSMGAVRYRVFLFWPP
jgi:nitrogen regulatory protein PII